MIAGARAKSVSINPQWTGISGSTGLILGSRATAAYSFLCAARASISYGYASEVIP
jgi:hypothetical protein